MPTDKTGWDTPYDWCPGCGYPTICTLTFETAFCGLEGGCGSASHFTGKVHPDYPRRDYVLERYAKLKEEGLAK